MRSPPSWPLRGSSAFFSPTGVLFGYLGEEAVVWWIVGSIAAVVLAATAFGVWMLAPSLRSMFGPDFEPAPKDDASVENAMMTRMVDGGQ
jgi:hypothetical protein